MMLWATEEQLRAAGRKEGRKRGQEELLKAFKDKTVVPSTVPQDLTKSKEELYGYEEYYTKKWQVEHVRHEAAVTNSAPEEIYNTIIRDEMT
jgi:hypothetical protein